MTYPLPQPGDLDRYLGDNSACSNSSCPSAKKCFRYRGKRSMYQSFACFTIPEGHDKCEAFLPIYGDSNDKC